MRLQRSVVVAALAGALLGPASLRAGSEAASGPAADATAAPRTLLVVPFAPIGDAPDWAGVAVAESLTDAVVQINTDAFLTLKQLDAVLRRRDLRLNDPRVAQQALPLARALGATELITGTVTESKGVLTVTGRRLSVEGGAELQKADASGARANLPALVQTLAAALLSTGQKPRVLTKNIEALELVSKCAVELDRQSLGPRSKTVLAGPRLESAEATCRGALAKDPKLGLAHGYAAILLTLRGRSVEARKEASAAQGFGRFVPIASLADWFAARRAGDADGAKKTLEKAVGQHPGFLHALGYLGEERQEAGDDQGALGYFTAYLKVSPGHPWASARAARALSRLGKKDEAIALTQKALLRSPDDPELLIELASRHIDKGDDAEAEKILLRVQDMKPPRPLASLRLGYLKMNQGQLKSSRDHFLKAVSQATREDEARTRAIAYADLAQVAGRENLYDNAVEALLAAAREGMGKLPCQTPELAKWKGKPEFDKACNAPIAPAGGFTDEEVVDIDLH